MTRVHPSDESFTWRASLVWSLVIWNSRTWTRSRLIWILCLFIKCMFRSEMTFDLSCPYIAPTEKVIHVNLREHMKGERVWRRGQKLLKNNSRKSQNQIDKTKTRFWLKEARMRESNNPTSDGQQKKPTRLQRKQIPAPCDRFWLTALSHSTTYCLSLPRIWDRIGA